MHRHLIFIPAGWILTNLGHLRDAMCDYPFAYARGSIMVCKDHSPAGFILALSLIKEHKGNLDELDCLHGWWRGPF